MKVIDSLKSGKGNIFSVEVEPPAFGKSIKEVFDFLDPLVEAGVSYIDITYHPEDIKRYEQVDGQTIPISRKKKPGTTGMAGAILQRYSSKGVDVVPHVICSGFTKGETGNYLVDLAFLGVRNLLALRGDGPVGPDGKRMPFKKKPDGHEHASDLIKQIADMGKGIYVDADEGAPIDFTIGAACYPEKHTKENSFEDELSWLEVKVGQGVDYLVTQMFFDNDAYKRFFEKARESGVEIPIVPGIKPISRYKQLGSLPETFGCAIPKKLADAVEKYKDSKDDIKKIGIDWCVGQCLELRAYGAPSLHFYAARGSPVLEVIKSLK